MQILTTKAAYDRAGEQLAAIAHDAEFIQLVSSGAFERDGQPVPAEDVQPEVVWLSFDCFGSRAIGHLTERIANAVTPPKWTQVMAAGIDNPVFRGIMERGVRLSRSDSQAPPIAEYVVAHALSLLFPIQAQAELQAQHRWQSTPYREIGHTRWLLVGFGNIGHAIAQRIKPFGVHLTAVRRSPAADGLADRVIAMSGLPEVLPEADVVVLACALNDETRGLCDADFLRSLKPGAILLNIGRGALVDEEALREGLDRDQPGHAVLDVFQTEPLPADSWFWDHPKVRVTGHTSNSGDGNQGRNDALFLENLRRYLADEPLINEARPSEVGL
jgi:phosphoglycerate dehydrogenase-like enzyme